MAQLIFGKRIGRSATLRAGSAAVIFDETGQKVLLQRREDNGRWALPGGGMDPGESAAETCEREVWEEMGLRVAVTRLIGIYTSPDMIVEYPDGNRVQLLSFTFEAEVLSGTPGLSEEVTEVGWFSRSEMENIDLMEHFYERLDDAFARQEASFVR